MKHNERLRDKADVRIERTIPLSVQNAVIAVLIAALGALTTTLQTCNASRAERERQSIQETVSNAFVAMRSQSGWQSRGEKMAADLVFTTNQLVKLDKKISKMKGTK